jgi:hypothetical protein
MGRVEVFLATFTVLDSVTAQKMRKSRMRDISWESLTNQYSTEGEDCVGEIWSDYWDFL